MIRLEELYEKTKIPLNSDLIIKILNLYFSISYEELQKKSELEALYCKINKEESEQDNTINQNDMNLFFEEINIDFKKAGFPYDSNPVGIQTGWNTFQSWNLLGTEEINRQDISHRIYLGVKPNDLYLFIKKLYDKFKVVKIPFYFKVDIEPNIIRKDKIVIYTSTQLLEKTLNTLLEVSFENKEIMSHCCDVSVFVGKITDKIGYASEDFTLNTSYTDLLCNIFIKSFELSIDQYLQNNSNKKALFNSQEIYIKDYYLNYNLEKKLKIRILVYVFWNNYKDYQELLLQILNDEFEKNGLDINNICLNKKVKAEIDSRI